MAKKPPVNEIEKEIKMRQRRIDNAEQKIASIRERAEQDIKEIEGKLDRDRAVLKALTK